MTVRDAKGFSQAVFARNKVPQRVYDVAVKTPRQSSVVVSGKVKESKAKALEVEIEARDIAVLSQAVHPLPFDPTGRVPASLDNRLDARALDLRNPNVAAIFKIRETALNSIRRTFLETGFTEVNTSKIIGQAAEGGANLFKLQYFDQTAYLAQSPQLYKEQLTMAFDRVFEVANFFRAEKSATRKHLSEFASVDMEAAFCDENDVMKTADSIVVNVYRDVIKNNSSELRTLGVKLEVPDTPFRKVTYRDVVEELKALGAHIAYGEDLTDGLLRRLEKRERGFYWVIQWPTRLKPFYIAFEESNPEISRGFDLQYGYLELASGGLRVSDPKILRKRIEETGLDPSSFSAHLKSFEWGMPPHAGWAMGLDRLTMILTGKKSIREVVLYPRDRFRLVP